MQERALTQMTMLHALKGRDLACWCALDGPCHAEVLLVLANHSAAEIKDAAMLDRFLHAPLIPIGGEA